MGRRRGVETRPVEMLTIIYAIAAAIAVGLCLWVKYTNSGRLWVEGDCFYDNVIDDSRMKYLLFSDIHGCLPALEKALDFFEQSQCDMMCIMGDIINYGPRNRIPEGIDPKGIVERLNRLADKIIAVRGNCDAEVDQMLLDFPIMETYALLVDGGKRYLLTHGHIYNKENMPKGPYDAIIYGHSHLWELSHIDVPSLQEGKAPIHRAICNTGSITFPKGGNVPTIATLENGHFKMYNLDTLEVLKEIDA